MNVSDILCKHLIYAIHIRNFLLDNTQLFNYALKRFCIHHNILCRDAKSFHQHGDDRQALVKLSSLSFLDCTSRNIACNNIGDCIIYTILLKQVIIYCKLAGTLLIGDVLHNEFLCYRESITFICLDFRRQVFPSSGSDILLSVNSGFDIIEPLSVVGLQECSNCRVNTCIVCVFLPASEISINHQHLQTVLGSHVKFLNGFVVLRWVTCCNNNPSFRNRLVTKSLILQEKQHSRCQRLRNTVDFIQEQNAFFLSSALDYIIHTGDNLAHCIFRLCICLPIISYFFQVRQANSTLSGVVCHGV